MTPDTYATVYILPTDRSGKPMMRTALFVYTTQTGVVWLEPSYLDPWNSAPADHQRFGSITAHADSFELTADDETIVFAQPIDKDKAACDAAKAIIEANGRTLAEERERMKQQLALYINFDPD